MHEKLFLNFHGLKKPKEPNPRLSERPIHEYGIRKDREIKIISAVLDGI